MPLAAEHGIAGLSLDEIAQRAEVTRNLLYHYFPRGRDDIMVAVGDRAGHELTDGWVTDESIPLEQRMASNFFRFFAHAEKPSLAWRVYRLAAGLDGSGAARDHHRYQDVIVRGVAQNNLGTPDPPPIARMAIKAWLAFGETLLDEARESDVPREEVLQLLAQTIVTTMDTIRDKLDASAVEPPAHAA